MSQVQAKVDFLQQRLKDVREQKEQVQKDLVRNSEAVTQVQSEVETALGSSESGKVMTVVCVLKNGQIMEIGVDLKFALRI